MKLHSLRMLRRPTAASMACCALLALAAPFDAEAQWSLSAYVGAVYSPPAQIAVHQPTTDTSLVFDGVELQSRSFESPIYYGYRVGRRVPGVPWLSFEAELIHAKVYLAAPAAVVGHGRNHGVGAAAVPFADVVQSLTLSHGMNFVLANVVIRRPITRRLSATARLGFGAMLPHVESEVAGNVRGDYQWAGPGAQVAGGAELRLWRAIALAADYKWTGARQHLSLAVGHANLTVVSHHVALGMAATF